MATVWKQYCGCLYKAEFVSVSGGFFLEDRSNAIGCCSMGCAIRPVPSKIPPALHYPNNAPALTSSPPLCTSQPFTPSPLPSGASVSIFTSYYTPPHVDSIHYNSTSVLSPSLTSSAEPTSQNGPTWNLSQVMTCLSTRQPAGMYYSTCLFSLDSAVTSPPCNRTTPRSAPSSSTTWALLSPTETTQAPQPRATAATSHGHESRHSTGCMIRRRWARQEASRETL